MIDNNIHELAKTAEEKRIASKGQANEAIDHAEEAGTKFKQAASTAASSASATLEEFGIYTDQMADTARRKTNEIQEALIAEIRANPLRAVGLAALFGYAFAVYRRF